MADAQSNGSQNLFRLKFQRSNGECVRLLVCKQGQGQFTDSYSSCAEKLAEGLRKKGFRAFEVRQGVFDELMKDESAGAKQIREFMRKNRDVPIILEIEHPM